MRHSNRRNPGRLRIAKERRAASRAEAFVRNYSFPVSLSRRVLLASQALDEQSWTLVERGLREWFICCAWRGSMVLGMPSRIVDSAWHEFILDSLAYSNFCRASFGEYLHHTPDESIGDAAGSLAEAVRAWDRSEAGSSNESVLWNIDAELGIRQGIGIGTDELHDARTRIPYRAASGWIVGGTYKESVEGRVRGFGGGCTTGGGCGGGCGAGA